MSYSLTDSKSVDKEYDTHTHTHTHTFMPKTKTAPYLGRMTDAGRDGMAQVSAMQVWFRVQGSGFRVFLGLLLFEEQRK